MLSFEDWENTMDAEKTLDAEKTPAVRCCKNPGCWKSIIWMLEKFLMLEKNLFDAEKIRSP